MASAAVLPKCIAIMAKSRPEPRPDGYMSVAEQMAALAHARDEEEAHERAEANAPAGAVGYSLGRDGEATYEFYADEDRAAEALADYRAAPQ